jgi:hypothetical protein
MIRSRQHRCLPPALAGTAAADSVKMKRRQENTSLRHTSERGALAHAHQLDVSVNLHLCKDLQRPHIQNNDQAPAEQEHGASHVRGGFHAQSLVRRLHEHVRGHPQAAPRARAPLRDHSVRTHAQELVFEPPPVRRGVGMGGVGMQWGRAGGAGAGAVAGAGVGADAGAGASAGAGAAGTWRRCARPRRFVVDQPDHCLVRLGRNDHPRHNGVPLNEQHLPNVHARRLRRSSEHESATMGQQEKLRHVRRALRRPHAQLKRERIASTIGVVIMSCCRGHFTHTARPQANALRAVLRMSRRCCTPGNSVQNLSANGNMRAAGRNHRKTLATLVVQQCCKCRQGSRREMMARLRRVCIRLPCKTHGQTVARAPLSTIRTRRRTNVRLDFDCNIAILGHWAWQVRAAM